MRSRLRHALPTFTLITALGIACSRERSAGQDEMASSGSGARGKVATSTPPSPAAAPEQYSRAIADAGAAPAEEAGAVAMPAAGATRLRDSASLSMIIRTGNASVKVDSLEPAIAAVRALAARLGGWVANTSLSAGEDEVRSAMLELKIPAARYDEALNGLKPLGKVETVSSNAEDVGEEFVDVSARVANARRLEERLITLLATKTGKLEDVLAVERELARVREAIDRYEGRLRYLRTRVATSTLTITVHEPVPLVGGSPSDNVILEAFRDMWRNFIRFIAAFIASLGTLIPVAVLVAIVVLVWRRLGGRLPSRRIKPAPEHGDAG